MKIDKLRKVEKINKKKLHLKVKERYMEEI